MRPSPSLEAAFRQSRYTVCGATVRIGQRSTELDRVLRTRRWRQGVLLTAWNPLSRRMPRAWNDRMQDRLAQALRRRVTCRAVGGFGRWWEDHLLLAGDPRPALVQLRRFRQWAGVHLRQGARARLIVLEWPNPR